MQYIFVLIANKQKKSYIMFDTYSVFDKSGQSTVSASNIANIYCFRLQACIHPPCCLSSLAVATRHRWPIRFRGEGIYGLLGQRCWVAIWQSVPDGRFLSGTFFCGKYDFVGSADGHHPESALIYNLFVQLVICS